MKKVFSLLTSLVMVISLFGVLPAMTAGAASSWESESNNSYSTADIISLGNTMKGSLSSSYDEDFYKITATANGKISLTFNHTYADNWKDWNVSIYKYENSEYKELSCTHIYMSDNKEVELPYIYAVKGSAYYIKVSNAWNEDPIGENYSIKLSSYVSSPTGFKVDATSSSSIRVKWNKDSEATGYIVCKYDTATKKIVRVGKTTGNVYSVKGLSSGTTYKLYVKAYKKVGSEYVYSNLVGLTSSTRPAAVNFKLTAGSKKSTVSWNKVTGASGYIVYYKTSANGAWTRLKKTTGTSFTKTGLTSGKTYYFTVRAYKILDGKVYYGGYTAKSVKVK